MKHYVIKILVFFTEIVKHLRFLKEIVLKLLKQKNENEQIKLSTFFMKIIIFPQQIMLVS